MQEKNLRKWHRSLGMSLAIFIIVQAGSGLLISLGHLTEGHVHEKLAHAHGNEKKTEKSGHVHNDVEGPSTDGKSAMSAIGSIFTDLHHGGGVPGSVYRILLAAGVLLQAVTGVLIFFKSRVRAKTQISKTRPSKKRRT